MTAASAIALVIAASAASQAEGPQSALGVGEAIETEIRADLNGDGYEDRAFIAFQDDQRELRVITSYATAIKTSDNLPQVLALDPDPLGPARLEMRGNVLLLIDLTGGTTALQTTHRFRWDPQLRAMRLIGLDATLYSRTIAHDGLTGSWNLLTGEYATHTLRLRRDDSDVAYDEVNRQRRRRPIKPILLQDSPAGESVLSFPKGARGG